jgi:hypothetical protein
MVADGSLDTIVTLAWVGPLAAVLLAQAFRTWLAHRRATESARQAARLARATEVREGAHSAAPIRPALRVVRPPEGTAP